jgi:hypothetical protein
MYHDDTHLNNFMLDDKGNLYFIDMADAGFLVDQSFVHIVTDYSVFATSVKALSDDPNEESFYDTISGKIFGTVEEMTLDFRLQKLSGGSDARVAEDNTIEPLLSELI